MFTFVPVVQQLPIKSIVSEEDRPGALTGKTNKNFTVSHEKTTGETMLQRDIFKVFIKDSTEGGAGTKLRPALGHMSTSQPEASASVSVPSENTTNPVAASMETAVDQHRDISQRHYGGTSGLAEVSSGFFANIASVSEDRMSPTNSADLFPTLASSRESILSEGSDREKSWSAMELSSLTSPFSLSRTVSPCSSVRSGTFTPSVIQIKRHFLAPGSSLIHTPCFSSCESLSSSVGPQSPPPPPRHRPPLTRLSLLTAILRKGRLPILSPALQRPYTPCWPINPVTLSFCNACSAASSVASIPLEFSSRFSSSASIDSQSHVHREPNRCATAPPPVKSNEPSGTCFHTEAETRSEKICTSSAPRWQQVISPPGVKSVLPRAPPLFCSNFKSVAPLKHEDINQKLQHTHRSISKSPEMKPINTQMYLKGPSDQNLKTRISPSPKVNNELETYAPQQWNPPPNSSPSKLHSLSRQLRSPPLLQPSQSRSYSVEMFCDRASPPAQKTTDWCEPGRTYPDSKSATTSSISFHRAHCLSPSRYTAMAFPGWLPPTSTPTPTPSPAPPIRDFTPSSSLSMRSTPSPRPGSAISDCSDREGKKRKTHRIKLNYKSLAAIPSNTLLLDQQAIDEQVEREESPCDRLNVGDTIDRGVADTHAEMCSPAELRQQSEELYAVIDEILADSIPASKTSRSSTNNVGLQQNNSSFTKTLGRETKYASVCSLHPSTCVNRKLMNPKKTKPGVIRPMTAIPRLTVDDEDHFHPNPFSPFAVKQTSSANKKMGRMNLADAGTDLYSRSKGQKRGPFSVCELQIKEPEDQMSPLVKAASTSFSPREGRMEAHETHI